MALTYNQGVRSLNYDEPWSGLIIIQRPDPNGLLWLGEVG